MSKKQEPRAVATNKKAYHDYFVEETYEAGLVLEGCEVKSLREGKANLKDSYGVVKGEEVFILNMHISPYSYAQDRDINPRRTRKLMLHKAEIRRLIGKTKEKGYTLIPLKVYFKGSYAKIELGLGKGKKLFDKRRTIAEKDAQRELQRQLKVEHRRKSQ